MAVGADDSEADELDISEDDAENALDEPSESAGVVGSSGGSDSGEDGEDDSEDGEDEEEEEEEILEPRILPNRTTRATRPRPQVDDGDSADEDFWNQEFFAEEDKDQEFEASESEEEDVPDSDFSQSEDEDDDDEDAVEARIRREEKSRRRVLKPPGAAGMKRQPGTRQKPPLAPSDPLRPASGEGLSPGARAALAAVEFEAPTLRKSTRQRVEDAEKERERWEQVRPRKRRHEAPPRLFTQEELVAEAAQTEIENTRSLELLQAAEEEVRKKAAVTRARHSGPCIHYHSKAVGGETLVTCEVTNMLLPPNMKRQLAPPPTTRLACAASGLPARYRDPLTGLPFHDAAAFATIRREHAAAAALALQSGRRRTGAWEQPEGPSWT